MGTFFRSLGDENRDRDVVHFDVSEIPTIVSGQLSVSVDYPSSDVDLIAVSVSDNAGRLLADNSFASCALVEANNYLSSKPSVFDSFFNSLGRSRSFVGVREVFNRESAESGVGIRDWLFQKLLPVASINCFTSSLKDGKALLEGHDYGFDDSDVYSFFDSAYLFFTEFGEFRSLSSDEKTKDKDKGEDALLVVLNSLSNNSIKLTSKEVGAFVYDFVALLNENSLLLNSLSEASGEINRLESSNEGLLISIKGLLDDYDSLTDEVNRLESDLGSAYNWVDSISSDVGRHKDGIDRLNGVINKLSALNHMLKDTISVFRGENSLLKDEVSTLEYENSSLSDKITGLLNLNKRLTTLVERDPLTGVFNRNYFKSRSFIKSVFNVLAEGKEVVVLSFDVKNFKSVNDRFGHSVGDDVLKAVFESIDKVLRSDASLFRFGGDEGGIVFLDIDEKGAFKVLSRMESALRKMSFNIGDSAVSFEKLELGLRVGAVPISPTYDRGFYSSIKEFDIVFKSPRGGDFLTPEQFSGAREVSHDFVYSALSGRFSSADEAMIKSSPSSRGRSIETFFDVNVVSVNDVKGGRGVETGGEGLSPLSGLSGTSRGKRVLDTGDAAMAVMASVQFINGDKAWGNG